MTLPAACLEVTQSITDPVGTRLRDLSSAWDASVVLEDDAGRVVSHALTGPMPACVVDAILTRCVAPIEAARGAASALGVMTGGPVLVTSLDGWAGRITVLPVLRTGRLWVLHTAELPLATCATAVQTIVETVERVGARATDELLLDALQGHGSWAASVPQGAGTNVVAVMSLSSRVPALQLHTALRESFGVLCAGVTATRGVAYVLARGATRSALEQAIQEAGNRLGVELASAFAPADVGLVVARDNADRALAARADPGRCLSLDDCRPYTTLPALVQALQSLTPLGGNPLEDLDAVHAVTLLAWLDDFGDLPAAAARLGVHPNTFRYRLNRAKEQVHADLEDPVARIDTHLRLRLLVLAAEGQT